MRIISGGQTGADIAGLHAAFNMGLETGGTAPKGWLVCNPDGSDGSNPDLAKFGLAQDPRTEYQNRTRKNVANSDGTVWVGHSESPGGRVTQAACVKAGKPIITNPNPLQLRAWLGKESIATLNVAGNRYSEFNPGIYTRTYNLLTAALGGSPIRQVHYLKTCEPWFQGVRWNRKLAEIRLDDRPFEVDDILCLQQFIDGHWTGLEEYRRVTHIMGREGFPGLADGYISMSITPFLVSPNKS